MEKVNQTTGEVRKITVYTSLTAHLRPKVLEVSRQPSVTTPDQSMSIRQIMDRHSRGLSINGKEPIYEDPNEENLGINPKTLDLTDLQALQDQNKVKISKLQSKLSEEQRQEAERRKKASTPPPTIQTPGMDKINPTT